MEHVVLELGDDFAFDRDEVRLFLDALQVVVEDLLLGLQAQRLLLVFLVVAHALVPVVVLGGPLPGLHLALEKFVHIVVAGPSLPHCRHGLLGWVGHARYVLVVQRLLVVLFHEHIGFWVLEELLGPLLLLGRFGLLKTSLGCLVLAKLGSSLDEACVLLASRA